MMTWMNVRASIVNITNYVAIQWTRKHISMCCQNCGIATAAQSYTRSTTRARSSFRNVISGCKRQGKWIRNPSNMIECCSFMPFLCIRFCLFLLFPLLLSCNLTPRFIYWIQMKRKWCRHLLDCIWLVNQRHTERK